MSRTDEEMLNILEIGTKEIKAILDKYHWKRIDIDYDDREVRLVYEHPLNPDVTVTLMFQE